MSFFKKEETLNLVVSFVALECALPEDAKNRDIWLSMVFKRGNQDRIESTRIQYESLQKQAKNRKMD